GIDCGLTARTRTSLPAMTSRLETRVAAPVAQANDSLAWTTGSLARRGSVFANRAASQPLARAVAICPAPKKPIRTVPPADIKRSHQGKGKTRGYPGSCVVIPYLTASEKAR